MNIVYGLSDVATSTIKEDFIREVGGNVGNLAFHHALYKILADNRIKHFPWGADSIKQINSLNPSTVIMPCANQIGAHMDMGGQANLINSLNPEIRFILIGLGVQANSEEIDLNKVPMGTKKWIESVEKRGLNGYSNILARGSFSANVIDQILGQNKAQVFGCPSILISEQKNLGSNIRSRLKTKYENYAILAGHHLWSGLARFESFLFDKVINSKTPNYIIQSDNAFFDVYFSKSIEEIEYQIILGLKDYLCPSISLTVAEFYSELKSKLILFRSVWEWIEYYTKYDVVVGSRIHGTILALQAGVPAVCLAHDSRTIELCRMLMVPMINLNEIESLSDALIIQTLHDHDWEGFDLNRIERARQLADFFNRHEVEYSNHLINLIH